MYEIDKRLFVGIKISRGLQNELDNCARGTERYLSVDKPEALQILTLGTDKVIGRFLQDGFPVGDIDNVSRNVLSIVQLIAPRFRALDHSVQIYVDCKVKPI